MFRVLLETISAQYFGRHRYRDYGWNIKTGTGYFLAGGHRSAKTFDGVFFCDLNANKSLIHADAGANVKHSDYGWNPKNYTAFALFGGHSAYGDPGGDRVGVFSWDLHVGVDWDNWNIGAKERAYGYNVKEGTAFTVFSARCGYGTKAGVSCCDLSSSVGYSYLYIGANDIGYCDYGSNIKAGTVFAGFACNAHHGVNAGAFSVSLNVPVSYSSFTIGAK